MTLTLTSLQNISSVISASDGGFACPLGCAALFTSTSIRPKSERIAATAARTAKEADRRGVDPIVLFIPDRDRASIVAWTMLRDTFPNAALVPVENEHVLWGELPDTFGRVRPFKVAALPAFLKSIIGRLNFSFSQYLRSNKDQSSELHQWVRTNYTRFRELELNLILHKLG